MDTGGHWRLAVGRAMVWQKGCVSTRWQRHCSYTLDTVLAASTRRDQGVGRTEFIGRQESSKRGRNEWCSAVVIRRLSRVGNGWGCDGETSVKTTVLWLVLVRSRDARQRRRDEGICCCEGSCYCRAYCRSAKELCMCLASSCICSLATAAMANIDRESGSASNRNHSHIFPTLFIQHVSH